MSFLLDTNICIYYLNGKDSELTRRILEAGPALLAISSLSVAELRFGAARSARSEQNDARIDRFVAELKTIAFDDLCARHFANIKAGQISAGKPIPDFDIAIAATALAGNLVVVSADRHIAEIPGVEVENWTSAESGILGGQPQR
jgi:tRNA(fMet)-specific endonuclease VapC